MRGRVLQFFVGALLMLAVASPAGADEKSTVKVALLDMSSQMPAGMMSYGMMSPGMTGMMGQGMMGPAMMGPGMMGQLQNQTYPGVMGPGMMMGMMSIRIDKPSVKAGTVTFDVTNWSRSVLHEMLVISVESQTAALPYDYAQARVPEEQVKVLGEAADLQPNASKMVDIALTPGSYLLVCNVPGHYAAGMVAALTVTP